jgi:hypothetical protein
MCLLYHGMYFADGRPCFCNRKSQISCDCCLLVIVQNTGDMDMKGNKFNVCATSLLGALVVLVVSVFVGCGVPETPLPTVSKEERALVVKASNHFAFDLYRELAKAIRAISSSRPIVSQLH